MQIHVNEVSDDEEVDFNESKNSNENSNSSINDNGNVNGNRNKNNNSNGGDREKRYDNGEIGARGAAGSDDGGVNSPPKKRQRLESKENGNGSNDNSNNSGGAGKEKEKEKEKEKGKDNGESKSNANMPHLETSTQDLSGVEGVEGVAGAEVSFDRFEDCFLSESEINSLQKGDKVDHRDYVGKFVGASIKDVTESPTKRIQIHYDGWRDEWDVWIDPKAAKYKLAKLHSISKRKRHRLFSLHAKGEVMAHPGVAIQHKHNQWVKVTVKREEATSGQVQLAWRDPSDPEKEQLFWAHLDNEKEIRQIQA